MKKFFWIIPVFSLFFFLPDNALALVTSDSLIKCPDFSSVYYLAEDGKRYVFPNDKVFFSKYENFDDVRSITCQELAEYQIGGTINYQAGTRLIKLKTDPKVYYPQGDGVLRPIKNEQQARDLFGEDWASRVDDLPEAFFINYRVEQELEEDILPDGTILEDEEGRIYEQQNGDAVEITHRLDENQKALKKRFALKLKNLKEKFKTRLRYKMKDDDDYETFYNRIKHKLKAKYIDESDRKIVTPMRPLQQLKDETKEAIGRAEREIAKAETRIEGFEFLAQAQEQINDAKAYLEQAKQLFEDADYRAAEQKAKDAQGKAAKIKDEDPNIEHEVEEEEQEGDVLGAMVVDPVTGIEYMKSGYASWYKYKDCDCAASPDFPKGSQVKVTAWNGNSEIVTINDWGPEREVFDEPRPIDLDYTVFAKLGKPSLGILRVEVEPVSVPLH